MQTNAILPFALFFAALFSPATLAQETTLQVGVVQRFGDEPTDVLTLSSSPGGALTLTFLDGTGQPQTLTTNNVKLEISAQPQREPVLQEWIVLSDRATFETAEATAQEWQKKGIEVEITQPGRWQVWAKRDVYTTPLLRRLLLGNLKAQGETEPYLQTQLLPAKPKVSFVLGGYRYNRDEIEIRAGNNAIRVGEGNPPQKSYLYGGSLKIQPNAYGNFTLVNRVPVETYLRGVVPHEIGASSPYASIEAQAILARTYALRNLRRFKADNYQLCATVHCQVYRGLSGTAAATDRAIANTQGQVLTYNGELIDALYSANSGGVTAPFTDIWDGAERPYLQGKIDSPQPPWDLSAQSLSDETAFRRFIALKEGFNGNSGNAFRWDKSRTLEELTDDLNRYLQRIKHPFGTVNRILKLEVTARSPSGRILTLTVQTDKGAIELQKTEARSAFEPPRSTLFYLDPIIGADRTLKGYRFIGGGFGHGVGMSQYGSYNLANLGWTSRKILAFYYPETQLEPLSESIIFYRSDGERTKE
ncbi:SpoIID/LytB domain-containing protein [Lusitaniella coriacea LEGE 07157]|uniref:SpoIID/LytB domain-containing protein n=1 Tax=Lusitaniella coriacea LEGE 07157 TaxID=945747 RepID=A0A8J7E5W4_9CYAN|nr:SpoIID/LytB domain-containing protein [Lusitaniella coriacea LEGE 07157]